MTAAREYQAIVARLSAAAAALRERDDARAEELRRDLVQLHRDVEQASQRAALTRFAVDMHWDTVLEALWPESWMKLRPKPGPDPRAAGADIDAVDTAVAEATDALLEAQRRSRFRLGR